MFRVAICDDNQTICSQIEKMILDYQRECTERMDILTFLSGEELYLFIKNEQAFDLIFLDIELDRLSGIDVGKKIREELDDNITQIVYISAKQDYAMELFKNRPLDFLVKPVSSEKVISMLNLAIKLSKKNNQYFEFSSNYTTYKILYKDIIYFASDNKKIRMFTTTEEYEFYGKLSQIAKQVEERDFIQIHKSHLVNYQYVESVYYEKIKLISGEELSISQAYRKDVRNYLKLRRTDMYR